MSAIHPERPGDIFPPAGTLKGRDTVKDYEYDTKVIEAADAYVLARESDQDGWDEYVALRLAVQERNEALIDGD